MREKTSIILPSETWAREFDAKLLLACCLAEKGFRVNVGCKNAIHMNITSFPRGLYLAKDFRVSSDTMFDVLNKLGHTIMAWDEEATLPFDMNEYHVVRVSPPAFEKVSAFFAWGPMNKEAIESAPSWAGAPVYLTGNPRGDLMRPELRGYFDGDVQSLKDKYGDIILINSNFGRMNHFVELERITPGDNDPSMRGRPASPRSVKRGKHKVELYECFIELVPKLARAFPDKTIIIRPHPSERFDAWRAVAEGHDNVMVIHKGHVHPWLLASQVMIHSSCTTGMEGYLLGRPVLGYQPITSEESVEDLPNKLSHNVDNAEELLDLVRRYSSGELTPTRRDELDALIEPIVSSMDGPLASDQIADKIEESWQEGQLEDRSDGFGKIAGYSKARLRALKKQIDYRNPMHKSSLAYDLHRFPNLELAQVQFGVQRLGELLGRFADVEASSFGPTGRIFQIAPKSAG